jgi:hypothetical protein
MNRVVSLTIARLRMSSIRCSADAATNGHARKKLIRALARAACIEHWTAHFSRLQQGGASPQFCRRSRYEQRAPGAPQISEQSVNASLEAWP